MLGRQEHHADRVAAVRWQLEARGHGAEEGIRDLQQDARAVSGVGIGAGGASMLEVAERLETLLDDRMRRLAPELGDQRHAAGVSFVGWVVEATWAPVRRVLDS